MSILDRIGYGAIFNDLHIIGNSIHKRSKSIYGNFKIEKEIAFYKQLNILCPEFPVPKIINYELHGYSMHYLSNHAPLYSIFGNLNIQTQDEILGKIFIELSRLHKHTIFVSRECFKESLKAEFQTKIQDRISEIHDILEPYTYLTIVNNVPLLSFQTIVDWLYERIDNYFAGTGPVACAFIHGDCQFNNILLNNETKDIKFIDPRGYWGIIPDGYGCADYDHAKVLFALSGYDVFDNSVIDSLKIDGSNITIKEYGLVDEPFGDNIQSYMALSIWLGNAHCFKHTPLKMVTSHFYARYLASKYIQNHS